MAIGQYARRVKAGNTEHQAVHRGGACLTSEPEGAVLGFESFLLEQEERVRALAHEFKVRRSIREVEEHPYTSRDLELEVRQ